MDDWKSNYDAGIEARERLLAERSERGQASAEKWAVEVEIGAKRREEKRKERLEVKVLY